MGTQGGRGTLSEGCTLGQVPPPTRGLLTCPLKWTLDWGGPE